MAAQLKNADPGSFPELITLSYTHEGSTDEKYFRTVERAWNLSSIHLQLEEFPFVAANRVGGAAPAWWEPRLRELAPDAPRFRGIPSACDPEEMARFMARLDCNASQLRQLILFEF
jgi:hypothetical protein